MIWDRLDRKTGGLMKPTGFNSPSAKNTMRCCLSLALSREFFFGQDFDRLHLGLQEHHVQEQF